MLHNRDGRIIAPRFWTAATPRRPTLPSPLGLLAPRLSKASSAPSEEGGGRCSARRQEAFQTQGLQKEIIPHTFSEVIDSQVTSEPQVSTVTLSLDTPPALPVFPVPLQDGPVGARLGLYWQNWQTIGAEPWVISVLRGGYRLQFDNVTPPLTSSPTELSYSTSHPLFQELLSQVQKLLLKKAVEPVDIRSSGFYSRLFLAPKKNGDWRPVIDLSPLNKFITPPKFKMETVKSILGSLVQGNWCTSLDLQDAFLHVPVAPRHRKYLRFVVQGQAYQFRAIPFGLGTSPYVFTRVVKAVGAYARSRGLALIQYLDDWNLSCGSFQSCKVWTAWLVQLAKSLGLVLNLPKSDLDPKQVFVFIGMLLDLITALAKPSSPRVEKFLLLARQFLAHQPQNAESWQRLLGHMTSLERLVPRGRLHMRPMQFQLNSNWSFLTGDPKQLVPMDVASRQSLLWWMDKSHLSVGVTFRDPTPDLTLFTDASTDGWGAHIEKSNVYGLWSLQQRQLHINHLELRAAHLALMHFLPQVRGKTVLLMTDNTTVVGQIRNQGGTRAPDLFPATKELFLWADSNSVILVPRHIPGRLNVIADRLSRRFQIIHTEWSLSLQVTHQLWKVWGTPHVDMFAVADNAKLPVYVSPLPDSQAWKIDALSFSWSGLWMYLFPPIPLLQEVLFHISQVQCEAVLVAPAWPSQNWFPLLLNLLVDQPRRLPPSRTLLKQPGSNLFHTNPEVLTLHGWRLSGPLSRAKATQHQWLSASRQLTGTVPKPSTIAGGESSLIGVLQKGTIHSLPLPL